MSFHTLAGVLLPALLAGCAAGPEKPAAIASHDELEAHDAAAPLLGNKLLIPNRIKGKHALAIPNAKYHLALESNEDGPPTTAQIFRAEEQRRAIARQHAAEGLAKSAGVQPSQWQSLGPGNVAGRIRAIAIDPRNANRVFVGAATGGLWLTENGGATWRVNNDFLPNLSITTIVIDPQQPDVMHMGTGEASQGYVGVGVFKSIDGGATWRHIATTNPDLNGDWRFVNRLAVHPTRTSVLLAGMTNNSGIAGAIYRSSDAGETWTRVSTLRSLDIAFDPNNPSNAVAGLHDGSVAYSRDAGLSWTRTVLIETPSATRGARAEIAFARSQPDLVYASVDNNRGEIWRSIDGGATWQQTGTPGHLGSQGHFANALWVDPLDASHLLAGGLDIYQSFDGGATSIKVSEWTLDPTVSPHADHHALVAPANYGPSNPVVYNGNDGGIYRALNTRALGITGWVNSNNGLNVTQFYSGAGRTAAGGRILGGTQDNHSLVLNQTQWRYWGQGDGGFVAVDPASDQVIYGELYYLGIYRSTNGGGNFSYICTGITEAYKPEGVTNGPCGANTTQKANFIAPFVLDPNNSVRMLAGANSLWVTDNLRQATAPTWRTIKAPSAATDNFINAIAVHEGNGNVIWVGHNNGEVYRATDGLATTPTWTRMGQGVIPGRLVQRIMVDQDNAARVIVAVTGFSPNNLWQSLDGGATWASITGNLPEAPIFDVKRHPRNAQWLYVATSYGVFTSENGGATWSTTNEGPANIRVRQLFWIDDNTLGAATFGRGMWKVNVTSGGPASYQDLWWAGTQENGWGMSISQHGSRIFAAMYIYDAQGKPVWVVLPDGTWDAAFATYSGALYAPTGSWFGSYDASRLVVGSSVGNASLTFRDANNATLNYTINGVAGSKTIQRQGFGPRDQTPVGSYADLWWGGTAQNGWGVAISQQYRTLFAVWYTYDEAGRTIWYVVPGGEWTTTNIYRGTAYRTSGSPWLGATYNPASFAATAVGTVTFNFTDINNAVMSYTIDGASGSKPITRQSF